MMTDFSQDLRRLKRLIRAGLPLDEQHDDQSATEEALDDRIEHTIAELERNGVQQAGQAIRLPFLTLKAEFYYHFGRDGSAASELDRYLGELRLRKRLKEWEEQHDQDFDYWFATDGEELRQAIWALMAVVFYQDYLSGNYDQAIADLRSIEGLIERDLKKYSDHPPDGSRARVHYFLGQCYRSGGEFALADEHFLEAEKYAGKRVERELGAAQQLKNAPDRIAKAQYEHQFGVVCTARVLGSIGRNALFQGGLHRALQNFYAARTLLASGQIPLKLVIKSHITITEGRLFDHRDLKWSERLSSLEVLYEEFSSRKDLDGMGRCAQELARVYLNEAEDEDVAPWRQQEALSSADKWITRLGELAARRAQPNRAASDHLKMHLLRALWCLFRESPDLDRAEAHMRSARTLDREPKRPHQLELAGFDNIDRRLVGGLLLQSKNIHVTKGNQTASAYFMKLRQEAAAWHDRVLESEIFLRMILSELDEGNELAALSHLQEWKNQSRPIENAALQTLYERAMKRVKNPRYEFKLDELNFDRQTEEAERFICNWAERRFGGVAQAEVHLGLRRGRLRELRKKWARNLDDAPPGPLTHSGS